MRKIPRLRVFFSRGVACVVCAVTAGDPKPPQKQSSGKVTHRLALCVRFEREWIGEVCIESRLSYHQWMD